MVERIDFAGKKTSVFGIQGSGKTFFIHNNMWRFRKPLIYRVNPDYDNLHGIILYEPKNRLAEFPEFCHKARYMVSKGMVDCIVIDEADLFFQTNWHLSEALHDLVLNHRHIEDPDKKGTVHETALWFATRRPQDIPTKIVEQSHYLICYKLEGKNAVQRFSDIHPKIPDMIERISYQKHNFVFKELGREPMIHAPIPSVGHKKMKGRNPKDF